MEKKTDDRLGLLGLLFVAHKALIGEELLAALPKVRLLLEATDAHSGTALSLERRAKSAHIPLIQEYSEAELGRALGRERITFIGLIDEKAAGAYLAKSRKKGDL